MTAGAMRLRRRHAVSALAAMVVMGSVVVAPLSSAAGPDDGPLGTGALLAGPSESTTASTAAASTGTMTTPPTGSTTPPTGSTTPPTGSTTPPTTEPRPSGSDAPAAAPTAPEDTVPPSTDEPVFAPLSVSPAGTYVNNTSFFAYVEAGETLDVAFERFGAGAGAGTATVRGPGVGPLTCSIALPDGSTCSWSGLSAPSSGIWRIDISSAGAGSNYYDWTIDVQDAGSTIDGRVWATAYNMAQTPFTSSADFTFWYQSELGFLYEASFSEFNGVNSQFRGDATGVALLGTCVSAYESMDQSGPSGDGDRLWVPPAGECGDPFKIFFEPPAADLPATATMWDGSTDWVVPPVVLPTVSDLTFTADGPSTRAGELTFAVTDFVGQLEVQIDTNGDGDYTDPVDRALPAAVTGDGTVAVAFDGFDGAGSPVPTTQDMNARVAIARTGEIHFANGDVERRGGLEVTAVNGPNAGSTTLRWNDTALETAGRTGTFPSPLDGRSGIDSAGGVHSWLCAPSTCNANNGVNGSWGDVRWIDDWTFHTTEESETLAIPGGPPVPGPCDGSAYSMSGGGPMQLYRISADGTTVTTVGDPTPLALNAMGYNAVDGYLYALQRQANTGPFRRLVRIDPTTGQTEPYPTLVTGSPAAGYVAAAAMNGNLLYVAPEGFTTLHTIDVSTNAVVGAPVALSAAPSPIPADFAFNPFDGMLYGFTNLDGTTGRVYRMDPVSGAVTSAELAITGLTSPNSGAQWFDGSGRLYGIDNGTGILWRIDGVGSPTPSMVHLESLEDPPLAGDGASCTPPDLLKDVSPGAVAPGATVTYTYTASNPTIDDLVDVTLTDLMPDDAAGRTYVDGTVTVTDEAGSPLAGWTAVVSDTGRTDDTLTITGLDIPQGERIVISVDVTVASDSPAITALNQATLTDLPAAYGDVPSDFPPTSAVDDPTPLRVMVPWGCPSNAPGLLFQTQTDEPTEINEVEMMTGAYETPFTLDGYAVNAVAYNVLDGFIYGVAMRYSDRAFTLVRIGGDGGVLELGFPTDEPVPAASRHIGDVDENGHYWMSNATEWFQIDLDPASPTFFEVLESGLHSGIGVGWADWAYVPGGGDHLYTVNRVGTVNSLYRFDRTTHVHSLVGDLGDLGGAVGAVFADANGFLYASVNATGAIFRIDVDAATATRFSTTLESEGNDGARCAISPILLDFGDAPDVYGTSLGSDGPRHGVPSYDDATGTAPLMLGATIDPEDDGQPADDAAGDGADDDGVAAPIVVTVGEATTVTVSATNGTGADAILAGWIDLDGNGTFEAGERQTATVTAGTADYPLLFPAGTVAGDTYARFRLFPAGTDPAEILPTGPSTAGEVEDHRVTVQVTPPPIVCPAGTNLVPVDLVQNPSFETRTGDFVNDDAENTINFAEDWHDSHPTGGQYHYFSPTFSSGPAPATMPIRAGAHGYGFMGGHSHGGHGEGATNALAEPLQPGLTYVGYFSMAATGYSREGDGFMRFFGTSDPDVGYPGAAPAPGQVAPTADNHEALYDTPVVEFPGVGVVPPWQQVTFTLQPTRAWDHLRVEVRNADPAADDTVAGQTWVNFDDFHMFLCEGAEIDKTSDPADGTPVNPGDTVTYTLTVTNPHDVELTDVPVLDDLADVLDDAELTAGPTVDPAAAGTATVSADELAATVDVPAGGTVTITYAVTIDDPLPAGSNRTLGNVVSSPGAMTCPAPAVTDPAAPNFDPDCITEHPIPEPSLDIDKTSSATADSRPGDVIEYTIVATNDGAGDYTPGTPAVVLDDLSGVLDDAAFGDDADADRAPDPTFDDAADRLSWVGPLPSGGSVTITYTVTLQGGGDGSVRNVAFQGPPCVPGTPGCTPVDPPEECIDGVDPATGLACDPVESELPKLRIVKEADTTELPAVGETVTYTVTIINEGPGDYTVGAPGTMSDDLTDVLDDATLDEASITADVGEATFTAPATLAWTGVLAEGEEAVVTYDVTYTAAGDHELVNRACVPVEEAQDPLDPCRSVEVPGSGLQQRKAADPAEGTSLDVGDTVTYTLYFENVGEAAAAVDTTDDLSGVLDDADLTDGPTSSDPALTAVLVGDAIELDGSVPVDGIITVTYTVTVRSFPDQSDHVLRNALQCQPGDPETCEPDITEHPIRHLSVTKTSDAVEGIDTGDTVTYVLTVTNDGEGDYSPEEPGVATDDLTGVLDDAVYGDDAVADVGSVSYAAPTLTWTGPLAAGEAATISYTVAVSNNGDHVLENVAGIPGCDEEDPGCNPPPVITLLPYVVPDKAADPESGTGLQAGDVVTYTLTWTNTGEAPGVVDATDDLSGIVDDGDVTSEPQSDDPAVTATRDGDAIRIVGPLAVGDTVTVTYEVTIRPDGARGDNIARNVLTPDTPQVDCTEPMPAVPGAITLFALEDECPPVDPPVTEHPLGELDDWKTVDPAAGTAVQAGEVVTYTLHFANVGEADVTVDREDVLTGVLDDATVTAPPTSSDPALTVSAVRGGRFAVSGTLAPDRHVTVTYAVTIDPDGERGDDRLGNFLVDPGEDPPTECVPTDDERADCTVNPVSAVDVVKSSNPASGTQVRPGGAITYDVAFTNTSAAGAATVDHIDHMADVLDDATLTGGPTSSDPALTAVAAGDTIRITGELAASQTVTITYTVTLKAFAQQGDHRLGNVVAAAGEQPVCAAGSALCTVHAVSSSGGSNRPLPRTGGDSAPMVQIAVVLLAAGVVVLLIARRRRHRPVTT